MNRLPDAELPRRARERTTKIAWIAVAVVGLAILGSFLIREGDDAPAGKPDKKVSATAVSAVQIERAPITQRGRYPGELTADATDVAAFYAGRLVSVNVRVGDTVKAGDVVAELDPVDAREQIAQARAQARAAKSDGQRARVERDAAIKEAERLEPLARDQLISALEIDRQRAKAKSLAAMADAAEANEAEAQARVRLLEKRVVESAVRAPFAGRVAARYVDPGATVTAGAKLVRIVQTSPLRVRFEVPERDVPRLANGTTLTVVVAASGTKDADGAQAVVTGIAGEIHRERRVATVEASIEKPLAGWLPGMFAEAIVDLRTIPDASIVPSSAVLSRLQPDGTLATGVFVATDDVARWIVVREVARDGDRVAIEGAIQPGARVLVSGHVDLGDGARIQLASEPRGSAGAR